MMADYVSLLHGELRLVEIDFNSSLSFILQLFAQICCTECTKVLYGVYKGIGLRRGTYLCET